MKDPKNVVCTRFHVLRANHPQIFRIALCFSFSLFVVWFCFYLLSYHVHSLELVVQIADGSSYKRFIRLSDPNQKIVEQKHLSILEERQSVKDQDLLLKVKSLQKTLEETDDEEHTDLISKLSSLQKSLENLEKMEEKKKEVKYSESKKEDLLSKITSLEESLGKSVNKNDKEKTKNLEAQISVLQETITTANVEMVRATSDVSKIGKLAEQSNVNCHCLTPLTGGLGFNQISCDDGSTPSCTKSQECYSLGLFKKGEWSKGCRIPSCSTDMTYISHEVLKTEVEGELNKIETMKECKTFCGEFEKCLYWSFNLTTNKCEIFRRITKHVKGLHYVSGSTQCKLDFFLEPDKYLKQRQKIVQNNIEDLSLLGNLSLDEKSEFYVKRFKTNPHCRCLGYNNCLAHDEFLRLIRNDKHKLAAYHIFKNAGTSVINYFKEALQEVKIQEAFEQGGEGLEDYFIFAIIRDPIDRFLSAYSTIGFRATRKEEDGYAERECSNNKINLCELLNKDSLGKMEKFRLFLDYSVTHPSWDGHVWNQRQFLVNRDGIIADLNFVTHIDELGLNLPHILKKLKIDPDIPFENYVHKNLNPSEREKFKQFHITKEDLNEGDMKKICKLYFYDFICFNIDLPDVCKLN